MIKIKINTDNIAFDNRYNEEIVRILRDLAEHFESGNPPNRPIDINGNTVGNIEYTGRDK